MGEEVEMDMTPMIDVSFQLLIFFILTINFKVLEGNLTSYLPKDRGLQSTKTEPKQLDEFKATLRYKQSEGLTTLEISGEMVAKWKDGDPITKEKRKQIAQKSLATYRDVKSQAPDEDPPVKIDAKSNVPSGRVISVLDILKGTILDKQKFSGARLMWTGNTKQEWGVTGQGSS